MRCILSLAYIIDYIVIEVKQGNCNARGEALLSLLTFLILYFHEHFIDTLIIEFSSLTRDFDKLACIQKSIIIYKYFYIDFCL